MSISDEWRRLPPQQRRALFRLKENGATYTKHATAEALLRKGYAIEQRPPPCAKRSGVLIEITKAGRAVIT